MSFTIIRKYIRELFVQFPVTKVSSEEVSVGDDRDGMSIYIFCLVIVINILVYKKPSLSSSRPVLQDDKIKELFA